MAPGVPFPANPDLADILGDMDCDFENCCFCFLFVPVREVFVFRLIQTLPTFVATLNWISILSIFEMFLDSKFPDFQVPRFPGARLGPGLG